MSVNLGYAPETFKTTVGNTTSTAEYQGFFAGLTYNLPVSGNLGVATGAQFRMNMRNTQETLVVTTKQQRTQALIDIPVLLNYGIAVNRDLTVTPFVGPMLSIACYGNTKTTVTIPNLTTTETNADWYDDNSNNSRFNLNAVFGASLGYADFKLFGGYRLGLLDVDNSDNTKVQTSGFFVGVGMGF